ncbi:MAG: pseudaminic acid synthase [Lachnospiraceae bacterium]|jgi:N-acetylneuraminate synthase/pseudaminic acid synthase|nr:pseudaminic acid synthase [Lachnospiraceae bacterium]
MNKTITIKDRIISADSPTFVVAEISGNHNHDYNRAVEIIQAAGEAGADAVKLQTYTPDTITLDCDNEYFQLTRGTIWDGVTLHELYQTAYTPWDWQPRLKEEAEKRGLICFSTPFDLTSVDFLAGLAMPAYKIASYEINDIPMIRKAAALKKPLVIATGIAYPEEISLALKTCREAGNEDVILLKCTSSYPTPYEDSNIKNIPTLAGEYDCLVGLSDHTLGSAVALGAVALGAVMVEKHLTLRRADGGPDAAFSMEPAEFAAMIAQIRIIEQALGREEYTLSAGQIREREGGRSLFAVRDIAAGETLTPENIRSVRPAIGLLPKHYEEVLGKTAAHDIPYGTPLAWEMLKP